MEQTKEVQKVMVGELARVTFNGILEKVERTADGTLMYVVKGKAIGGSSVWTFEARVGEEGIS